MKTLIYIILLNMFSLVAGATGGLSCNSHKKVGDHYKFRFDTH